MNRDERFGCEAVGESARDRPFHCLCTKKRTKKEKTQKVHLLLNNTQFALKGRLLANPIYHELGSSSMNSRIGRDFEH